MPVIAYAFRVGRDAAFLTEEEWQEIEPLLRRTIEQIKEHRRLNRSPSPRRGRRSGNRRWTDTRR